ncbi:MAG: hypothetical protein K6A23_05645 [Butyrivibrio sp.]|nr:hypothetical protein [Butyrivibrio sp.]
MITDNMFKLYKKIFSKKIQMMTLSAIPFLLLGCGNTSTNSAVIDYSSPVSVTDAAEKRPEKSDSSITFDGSPAIKKADILVDSSDIEQTAENYQVAFNQMSALSVPTYITEYDGLYFIVDCYHSQVIYSDSISNPLTEWMIMTDTVNQAHTIASDGDVYLIDDTENNRVLVYEKCGRKFINTQVFNDIGTRPHFTTYDEYSDTFYTWSSATGELYCFKHSQNDNTMYLTEIRSIEKLNGVYVRSFTIVGDYIYFVSGVSAASASPTILCCRLDTLDIVAEYEVPDSMAGMVQITPIGNYFYISISTDINGSQDYATLIRTKSLENLMTGDYEDIYSTYFVGGGTPYYMSQINDLYYLTEHRLPAHSIWSFSITDDNIENVTTIY